MFDQVFEQSPGRGAILRRKKTLMQKMMFWLANALFLPLVALCYLTISAEGLRQMMPVFSLKLWKTPVPGAGYLRDYDGWNRLDLSMLMAFLLFGAVTMIWFYVFKFFMERGSLSRAQADSPVLFLLLSSVLSIILLGDCLIFYLGLESKAANSWGSETPDYIPLLATILYMAGLALIGAWHADYHRSQTV